MADFAPHYTPRYRVLYRVGGKGHRFTWRLPRGTSSGVAITAAEMATDFLDLLGPVRYTSWTVEGAEWANTDSNVFFPVVAPSPVAGSITEIGASVNKMITQYRFEGKGTNAATASKVNFPIFGLSFDQDDSIVSDYRISAAESDEISQATNLLNIFTSLDLFAIDNSPAIWRPYVNVKTNDRWRNRVRKGG